jgi:hypothetical protein
MQTELRTHRVLLGELIISVYNFGDSYNFAAVGLLILIYRSSHLRLQHCLLSLY